PARAASAPCCTCSAGAPRRRPHAAGACPRPGLGADRDAGRGAPPLRPPAPRPPLHPHCHSLVAGWPRVGGGPWPAWRRCFTEARRPASLARDVPGLLGYRPFLAALVPLPGIGGGPGERLG